MQTSSVRDLDTQFPVALLPKYNRIIARIDCSQDKRQAPPCNILQPINSQIL